MASAKPRFDLYVKAGADGVCVGDCPFSQRSYMFMVMHIPKEQFRIVTIDTSNKPQAFLQLNPDGKVPVLVDHGADGKITDDSGKINTYLGEIYPCKESHCGYHGPAAEASDGVFPKLAKLLKNQDVSKTQELKDALLDELVKLNGYLCCDDHKGKTFLLGDCLSDLDCALLPKLNHVCVAAKEYKGFEIPEELSALCQYINNGRIDPVWKKTCPPNNQIVFGWSKYNILKET